jgi:pyruvate dehydrogenase E2 component (dihydrolipoamide acetyltransferase)
MPQIASDMTEADVVSWLVEPGDRVEQGEIVLEIETEKSTVEVEAPASGVLAEIRVAAGTTDVAVGTVLATIDVDQADGADADGGDADHAGAKEAGPDGGPDGDADEGEEREEPAEPGGDVEPAPARSEAEREGPPPGAPEAGPDRPEPGPTRAPTALARRVAEQAGVDLTGISGTGPRGRVVRRDVEERLAAGPGAGAGPDRDAARAAGHVGALRLSARCRVDALLAVRDRLDDSGLVESVRVSDLLVRALAGALAEVPEALPGESSEDARGIGIAIAVPGSDGTLITPVIEHADEKGLGELAREARDLGRRARDRELTDDDFDARCFAVLDLGLEGVDDVEAPLDASRAGVLALGAPRSEPVVEAGAVRSGTAMTLSLAVDPARVPETVAARLLSALRRRVEHPLEMLT